MKKIIYIAISLITFTQPAYSFSRIKDVVSFEGVRENHLIGYGLVVGLNGTGDNLNNSVFTEKGLTDFLERLGINTRGANLKTKNIAAVTVTATLPPFSRQGSKIDISASTLGDAKSLQGGTLLPAPLVGADGEVYAVAQGSISIGGFAAATKASITLSKAVATNGFIQNGGIIEKEIDFDFRSMRSLKLSLHNPDITTALDIANKINREIDNIAKAIDPGTVELLIPENRRDNIIKLLAEIEQLVILPDQIAKIIIDEASGTIVMGDNVKISPVAVSQGNLSVSVKNNSKGIPVSTDPGKEIHMLHGADLKELVNGLNALGVGPRDLITILQNIKVAGALQAEIETR